VKFSMHGLKYMSNITVATLWWYFFIRTHRLHMYAC
jgi:hypothetical protein